MILACNFEEVTALTHGAQTVLTETTEEGSRIAAPSAARGAVEALLPRLTGDLSVRTLADQRRIEQAVETIVMRLRQDMQSEVLHTHPAAEEAVAAYFDFAHALAVLGRLQELGREMRALIEVMTGGPPTQEMIRAFRFPE